MNDVTGFFGSIAFVVFVLCVFLFSDPHKEKRERDEKIIYAQIFEERELPEVDPSVGEEWEVYVSHPYQGIDPTSVPEHWGIGEDGEIVDLDAR